MKTYTTTTGQNIFDVCIMLYGSIEGMIDLIVSNPSLQITDYGPTELEGEQLTLDTKLSRGVILNYHEDIDINDAVKTFISDNNLTVSNGDHDFRIIEKINDNVKMLIIQTGLTSTFNIMVKSGTMYIDWGDTTLQETYTPSDGTTTVEHIYNSTDTHIIKILGTFTLNYFDYSECNGIVYPTSKITATTVISNNNNSNLTKLFN